MAIVHYLLVSTKPKNTIKVQVLKIVTNSWKWLLLKIICGNVLWFRKQSNTNNQGLQVLFWGQNIITDMNWLQRVVGDVGCDDVHDDGDGDGDDDDNGDSDDDEKGRHV